MQELPPPASAEQWTLVRRARQLVTLQGPGVPRRGGAMMEDIGVITDGALLIRNGLVEEFGPSRRVENLESARRAREVDAAGRIVLPAFVDPDAVLAFPRFSARRLSEHPRETPIHLFSKRRLEGAIAQAAADFVRHGVLTVGAHTRYALNLRDTVKVLRAQQSLQGKPLRIRSVLWPESQHDIPVGWLEAARQRKMATVLDLALHQFEESGPAAAARGYGLRIRSGARLSDAAVEAAASAAAVAVIAPPTYDTGALARYSAAGGIHVINADPLSDYRGPTRHELEHDVALALSSGYSIDQTATANPQYVVHLAVTRLGMSVAQAITALTWNAACSLRVQQFAGSLEPGKPADLVILDLPDYRDLARRAGHNDVSSVMRNGRTVYRRSGLTLD